jgi:uncharacterized protein with PQ loop repeat
VNLTLATAVGLAGALLAFACTVPQAARLMRMRTAAGVSVAALASSTSSGLAWTVFGVVRHDVWIALPALLALPATAAALVLAWLRGGSRDRLWLPVAWAITLLVVGASSAWVGDGPITVVLGCSIALMVTPAAVTAWRSPDVSALAPSAWLLLVVDGLIAGAYGVLAGVEANLLYAAVAIVGAVAVLIRIALPAHVHARLVPTVVDLGEPLADLGEPLARERYELAS